MPKKIEQLSFRIELNEGLFVKYASAVYHKVPGQLSSDNKHSAASNRKKESKTTKMVCCVSEAWEYCVLVWCGTLHRVFPRLPHSAEFLR
jgi:hypothetical protein